MMHPTLKIEHITATARQNGAELTPCHIFGIFLYDKSLSQGRNFWILADETCSRGVEIRILSDISNYPCPKPGDVVRIHRLNFDKNKGFPIVFSAKDVVVWRSFRNDPVPIHSSEKPTITDEDLTRRDELERFYLSKITSINKILNLEVNARTDLLDVSGRIENKSNDSYCNLIITLNDGSGIIDVRVFKKQNDEEDKVHYLRASELNKGDYMIVHNAKYSSRACLLDLSANLRYCRWLRKVEILSHLGRELTHNLTSKENHNPLDDDDDKTETNNNTSQTTNPVDVQQSQPRRSKRLQARQEANGSQSSLGTPSPKKPAVGEPLPEFTAISNIEKTSGYRFYDLAGQVRGQPNEAPTFQNWCFQLYDGSKPVPPSFYSDNLLEPLEDCVTILVYSKQKPEDTSEHIDKVKCLKEGDFVYIKNIRATWTYGKLRLDLSANLQHGKSISIVNKNSRLGGRLVELCAFPQVEELTEQPSEESF